MSLITSMFIAKFFLIISFRLNKFLFFCEAFMKIKTKSAMFEKNIKYLKCDLIKSLMNFCFILVVLIICLTFRFNLNYSTFKIKLFSVFVRFLLINNTFIFY